MLNRLYIQNYAIIDEIDILFASKLNMITGETGAGKSILMGALSLILGNRADSGVLVNKAKKCVIEGTFNIGKKENVKEYLAKEDLDAGEDLLIRREIAVNGKSRAFINDTPVNLDQLREVASMLVDLHQQFDTLELKESDFQREVIDALAGNGNLLEQYHQLYTKWIECKKSLQELNERKKQFQKEFDYNQFLYNELEEAKFSDNELEDLEAELKLQSNAEGIKSTISAAVFQLSETDQPIVQQLKTLLHQLETYIGYQQDLPVILERLGSAQIELQDIADELDRVNRNIQYDPQRIESISERISTGYKLLKKHGVKTTSELLKIRNELGAKLQAVLNIDEEISDKERVESELHQNVRSIAAKLHAKRSEQAKPLEKDVNKLLSQVGMPNAKLKVEVAGSENLHPHGSDNINFLFDANRSGQYLPVGKVASGGELSRLMLCIKSLVAKKIDLPTMIFDEIDTGISGEAAKQVGIIMKEMAGLRQVICITHLPQIAGKADAHLFVYKEIVGNSVKTNIKLLNQDERITAIAKMLSGEKPTAAAIENAKEMILDF